MVLFRCILAATMIWALTACGTPTQTASTNAVATTAVPDSSVSGATLNVVATTTLVADAVRSIAGDTITLTTMIPPGIDAHSYEPTPQDIKAVADADIVFSNGVGYEEFMAALIENAGGNAQLVEVSDGITLLEFEGDHGHEGEGDHAEEQAEGTPEADHAEGTPEAEHSEEEHAFDPHVWFNPQNVKIWATNIERTLSTKDAANAATYKANADAYRAMLDELDAWAETQVASIPEANRVLVTDHGTFGYLAQRYGFELAGAILPSVSSAAEPSAQELAEIEEIIRANNVPAVFVASEANARVAQQVGQDTGAQLVTVYVESLSEAGGEADTYEKFMRFNIAKIVESLQ